MRMLIVVLIGLSLSGPPVAEAQKKCVKGIPCGNTCISAKKVCRVGGGGATWRSPEDSARVAQRRAGAAVSVSRTACEGVRVVDGDTIECGGTTKVRLIGIDSPEMDQGDYGSQARDALQALIPESGKVELEYDVEQTDRYGRALAYVWAGDRHLNLQMLQQGWAMILTYPPNVRHVELFRAGQASARVSKRGLWAIDAFACTPKDHRDKKCE